MLPPGKFWNLGPLRLHQLGFQAIDTLYYLCSGQVSVAKIVHIFSIQEALSCFNHMLTLSRAALISNGVFPLCLIPFAHLKCEKVLFGLTFVKLTDNVN